MDDDRDFASYYSSVSDAHLLEIAEGWDLLFDDAKEALRSEYLRRGLDRDFETVLHRAITEPANDIDYRNLVTIRQYRDLSEAIVARCAIESAGIFCFLKDENFVRLDWQMSNLIGGIRLQVAASDVSAAEAVLALPIPETIASPDEPYTRSHYVLNATPSI